MMLEAYAERYRRDLVDAVIPFWLRHALDHEHGGYFTCLDRDGTVYDSRKYMWLQGRAVWMFARLYRELEPRDEWLAAARLGVDFIRRYGRDAEGRIFFSLTREGQPFFFQRKPYAAVFVQMGLFEYGLATGDPACLDEAVALFWRIVAWIEQPTLLGRPVLPGQVAVSQLADRLVVGMMALELARQFDDPRYDEVLRTTVDGVLRHYDATHRVFREVVAHDGRDLTALPEGRLFSPGHTIETVWILLHMLARNPDAQAQQVAFAALAGALELGWDAQYDGLFYFMDLAGRPTLQLEATMKLWWPHAEAIYALVLAYTLTREAHWLTWLERVDRYTYTHFVDPVHGEWFGYCDRRGDLALTSKGGNYKGFFHVPRALLFSLQAIDRDKG
ncbi:AGE family epimerase/isomerase [Candidatus Chloroploca mongolica]|nr:AGE family epimerase/isomerase [Candidatus Chloroploca mongolica]